MPCHIEWNSLSLKEWQDRYNKVRYAPLLQSYDYAMATHLPNGRVPIWGVIKIDGNEAGIVQIAKAALPLNLFDVIILDMGPLWFDHNNLAYKSDLFFKEFNRQFPRKINRKRRIIPYLEDKREFNHIPASSSYRKQKSSYQTIWLDIEPDTDVLRSQLKQKWRNQLNKSEKQNLEFLVDEKGETFAEFLTTYQIDLLEKNYQNISPKNLKKYFHTFLKTKSIILLHALKNNKKIASSLILLHGNSATYQIGLLDSSGRDLCANHFLLWQSVLYLKERGIKDFDLGGINEYDAKGIQHFKEGLNGQKKQYKGIYS